MKKTLFALLFTVTAGILAGVFIPIDSYTTTNGCPVDPIPERRLHLILGDSIKKIQDSDNAPPENAACSVNTKYVLYVL